MSALTLADLWLALRHALPDSSGAIGETPIRSVVIDSRQASPDSLFVALRGEHADGHDYVRDAIANGAAAVIAEERALTSAAGAANFVLPNGEIIAATAVEPGSAAFVFVAADSLGALQSLASYWHAKLAVDTIAITGSVGKTTTKETVANVLSQRWRVLASAGNLNNEIGVPLTLLQLEPGHQKLIVEMGMYDLGEIARLCELARPRVGVVTNVGPTHMERLGSIQQIARAKAELVQALPAARDGGVAILNSDDALVRAMAGLTQARIFRYGLDPTSDLWADDISSRGLEGIRFRFHYGEEAFHVTLPLLGRHSVHTALRAAAVGLVTGLSWTEILAGLLTVRGQLRLLVVPGPRSTTLIDDTYNASPDSMLAALNLLEEIVGQEHRCIAVLGDMAELGSYEETGHRLVGGRAAQVVDKLITVGRRARWIADEALATGLTAPDVHVVDGNNDAIAILQGLIRPGDVILIKGSRAAGMEAVVDALCQKHTTEGNRS